MQPKKIKIISNQTHCLTEEVMLLLSSKVYDNLRNYVNQVHMYQNLASYPLNSMWHQVREVTILLIMPKEERCIKGYFKSLWRYQPHQISLHTDISKWWLHKARLHGSMPDVKRDKANSFRYLNTFAFPASALDERMHLSTCYWSEDRNEAWRWANVKTNSFTPKQFLTLISK